MNAAIYNLPLVRQSWGQGALVNKAGITGADFVLQRDYAFGTLVGVMKGLESGQAGAFMSMVARTLLEDAVLMAGEDDPAGILRCADGDLRHLLATSSSEELAGGKLAAAFVWIEHGSSRLRFAGAGMTLLLSEDGVVRRLEGKACPLNCDETVVYTNREVAVDGELKLDFLTVAKYAV